jgi:carboxyl-terminal processing protease
MRNATSLIAAAVVLALTGCGRGHADPAAGWQPAPGQMLESKPSTPAEIPSSPASMRDAEGAFAEVRQLIDRHYVDGAVPADVLWTGATRGMLAQLIQTKDAKVNALLSPEELAEMRAGIAGGFSGIGAVMKTLAGVIYIEEVLPNSPAAKAALEPGDRLLAIDGQSTHGMGIAEAVRLIRGTSGTTIDLTMQRDDREWHEKLTRGQVRLPTLSAKSLGAHALYVRISGFSKDVADELDRALAEALGKERTLAVVLDLRACPGGLLEGAVAVAERFLAPGTPIVDVRRRDGEDEWQKAEKNNPGDALPVVVLVGGGTASGAEIVTAALAENGRAMVVGERTFGKGTVEELFELSNGWAVKLTIARFYSPKGRSLQGAGVDPDFIIPSAPETVPGEVVKDAALAAALRLLELGSRR